jgi:hypothetical protein
MREEQVLIAFDVEIRAQPMGNAKLIYSFHILHYFLRDYVIDDEFFEK